MASETAVNSSDESQLPPTSSSNGRKVTSSSSQQDVVQSPYDIAVKTVSPVPETSTLPRNTPSKTFIVEDVVLPEDLPESAGLTGESSVDVLSGGELSQGSHGRKVHFSLLNGVEADRNGSASDGPSDWSEDERSALSDKVSIISEDEGADKESSPSISRSNKDVATAVTVEKKMTAVSAETGGGDAYRDAAGGVAVEKEVSTSSTVIGEEVPSLEEEVEGGSVRGGTSGGGEESRLQQQQVPSLPNAAEPLVREDRAVAYSPDKRFLKYDIEIGRGSFKTVYKALDTETGVAVAWCELQENRYNKSEQLRFKDEVKILKTLQHPNILRLYESWESTQRGDKKDRKVLVLVTELMTSGTLKGYMRRLKAIKPKVIRSWGRQILRGLHFLHTRTPPIIHRDLKCDNIFINGTTGLVKIGDLGLATLKRSDVKTVIGTPEFMAPEMYEENYDESVDVYAFGMCLLEMCTQEYPYMECSNPAQIYKRVTQGVKPNALEKVKNEVLLSIIANCTVVSKKNRYNVKMLLSHEFFAEGVKIEPLKGQGNDAPVLALKMEVPTKETSKKNNQESIEFSFDLEKDTPEGVVSAMVKTSLLRADEQIRQNCVRSLRDYVDTVKQKRRQVNKDKEDLKSSTQQLSSGSESNIGDLEQSQAPPKLQHQLSSSEGSPQAGQESSANGKNGAGGVSNGCDPIARERTDSVVMSGGTSNGHHSKATPTEKVAHSKGEVQPSVGGGDGSSQSHLRTMSESTPSSTSQSQHLEVPSKSTTAPNTTTSTTSASNGTSSGESEDRRSYASAVSASKPPKYPSHSTPSVKSASTVSSQTVASEPSVKGSLNSSSILSNSTGVGEEVSSSPSLIHTDIVSVVTTGGGGGNLEASSTSSLNQDSGTERGSDRDKPAEGGATERQVSANGKKRASRSKRQLKLDFQELATGNVVKCTLNTSAGQSVDFRFSLEYDKPSAIFRQLEKAGHLAASEEENFLRQITQLVHSVKKDKSHANNAPSSSSAMASGSETRTHSSSMTVLDDAQGSKSMPSLTSEHPPISPTPPPMLGTSEDIIRKTSITHDSGMLVRDTPTRGGVEVKEGGSLSILDEGVAGSVSELVSLHCHTSQDQDTNIGTTVQATLLPTGATPTAGTHPPASKSTKKYEVAEVDEPPESPPPSDISAQSSTDNVVKDVGALHSSDLEPHPTGNSSSHVPSYGPRQFFHSFHPQNLESQSECQLYSGQAVPNYGMPYLPPHAGGSDGTGGVYSCTPEPTGDYYLYQQTQHFLSTSSRHVPVTTATTLQPGLAYDPRWPHPPAPQSNMSRHPSVPNMSSLPVLQQQGGGAEPVHHHTYHAASALQDHQYASILPEYNPYHPQATPTPVTTSTGPSNTVASHLRPHTFPATTHTSTAPTSYTSHAPRSHGVQNLPGFSDVPQPELLAKAFMVFLHAMGKVFKDPAFGPLLDSLENHCGLFDSAPSSTSHHSATGRSESELRMRQSSYSPPPLDPHQHHQSNDRPPPMCHTPDKPLREDMDMPGHTHRNKSTPPCITPEKHMRDEVEDKNRDYYEQQMRILDEEMRELESRKQQIVEQYMKRGSGSSSLDGSGHLTSKKSSVDSMLGSPVQQHRTSPFSQSHVNRLADLQERDKTVPDVAAAPQSCHDPPPDYAAAPQSLTGPTRSQTGHSSHDTASQPRHDPPTNGIATESDGNSFFD